MSYGKLFDKTTKTVEQTTIQTFEPAQKKLPSVLKDVDGQTYSLSVSEITKFGMNRAQKSNELNNQILSSTMVSDSGAMTHNMMQVMALTEKVDLDALNDNGFFGKLRGKFQDAKLRVKAQYTSVEKQIDDVVVHIKKDLDKMRNEADWLENIYYSNNDDIIAYGNDLEIIQGLMKDYEVHVQELMASTAPTNTVEEARVTLNALSRQVDVLVKMKSISDITAPEVRSLQISNIQNIEKFNNIITATIPIWKKQMGIALQSNVDRERIEQGKKLDAFTDNLIRETAKQVGQNIVESTKASQSNVASADAIVAATQSLTKDIRESIALEKAGHEKRKQNAVIITDAVNSLKEAIRGN